MCIVRSSLQEKMAARREIYIKRWYLNNSLQNYNYLIVNKHNNHCLIIDPTYASIYVEYIESHKLIPEAILLTHHHFDHISGVGRLSEEYNCAIYGNSNYHYEQNQSRTEDNKALYFHTVSPVVVVATPGHTSSHVCFHLPLEKMLFCGDTVFAAGIGNTNDPSADINALYYSVLKLMSLPMDTHLYCAHDYFSANLSFAMSIDPCNKNYQVWFQRVEELSPQYKPITTIWDEYQINIFFQAYYSTSLRRKVSQRLEHISTSKTSFIYLREQKDIYSA